MRDDSENILDVTVLGSVVGQLQSLGKDRTVFLPAVSWLEGGQRPPLGLAFLGNVNPREVRGGSITPWFENLLPEQGTALRRWLAKENGLNARDSLAMLALKLGKVDGFRKITRKILNRFARRSSIPDAEERFLETLELIRDAWPCVTDSAPVRMREALLNHWQNVPLLRDIGELTDT